MKINNMETKYQIWEQVFLQEWRPAYTAKRYKIEWITIQNKAWIEMVFYTLDNKKNYTSSEIISINYYLELKAKRIDEDINNYIKLSNSRLKFTTRMIDWLQWLRK